MPPAKDRIPFRVKPMLATLVRKPFDSPGWTYEEKYDGYRILAYKEGDRVTLLSRNANDRTATYASVARAVAQIRARTVLLDGEVVAFDKENVSRFQLLQNESAAAVYALFDCLYASGRDLRREPLRIRRHAAEPAIGSIKGLMILAPPGRKRPGAFKLPRSEDTRPEEPSTFFSLRRRPLTEVAEGEGASGRRDGPLPASPSPRSRHHFGALLLAAYENWRAALRGKVGTGFTDDTLASLYAKFKPLVRSTPSLADPPRERASPIAAQTGGADCFSGMDR